MLLVDSEPTQIIMISYFRPNDFRKSVESVLTNTVCPFHLSIIDNSSGHLNQELDKVEEDPRVTIYRNQTNIGKGAGVNLWYDTIMKGTSLDHVVSIDGDVVVPFQWLLKLKRSLFEARKHCPVGFIAPAISDSSEDTWEAQLNQQTLSMHQYYRMKEVNYYPGLYYNGILAGPLFMIDRKFFEKNGLYYDGQLYGADDGGLCKSANKMKLFIGIDSNVVVEHSNDDTTIDYKEWKRRNITKGVDQCGHWD